MLVDFVIDIHGPFCSDKEGYECVWCHEGPDGSARCFIFQEKLDWHEELMEYIRHKKCKEENGE
jgi:hypothetical protein